MTVSTRKVLFWAVVVTILLTFPAIFQSSLFQSPSGSRTASPASSSNSRKPPTASKNYESNGPVNRKDSKTRISFFDSANQGVIERLLVDDAGSQSTIEGEEETAQAIMSNVEDMLEGYDWASDDVIGRKHAKGTVDLIEARLTGELMALENVRFNYSSECFLTMVQANIHSFLESDDQVTMLVKHMDEAIAELDNLDSTLSSYKIHLNVSLLQGRWQS